MIDQAELKDKSLRRIIRSRANEKRRPQTNRDDPVNESATPENANSSTTTRATPERAAIMPAGRERGKRRRPTPPSTPTRTTAKVASDGSQQATKPPDGGERMEIDELAEYTQPSGRWGTRARRAFGRLDNRVAALLGALVAAMGALAGPAISPAAARILFPIAVAITTFIAGVVLSVGSPVRGLGRLRATPEALQAHLREIAHLEQLGPWLREQCLLLRALVERLGQADRGKHAPQFNQLKPEMEKTQRRLCGTLRAAGLGAFADSISADKLTDRDSAQHAALAWLDVLADAGSAVSERLRRRWIVSPVGVVAAALALAVGGAVALSEFAGTSHSTFSVRQWESSSATTSTPPLLAAHQNVRNLLGSQTFCAWRLGSNPMPLLARNPPRLVIDDRCNYPKHENPAKDTPTHVYRVPEHAPSGLVGSIRDGQTVELTCFTEGQRISDAIGNTSTIWLGIATPRGLIPDVSIGGGYTLTQLKHLGLRRCGSA